MEILQTKIYNKTDNFNLTKGQSYPDLKSTFIVHQKDNKHGKIYITDYNGYCIEIFDIELNQKIEDLIRNFDAYKLSVSQQFNQFKSDLQDYAVEKDSALKTELIEKITENKTSLDNLKKKLPKDLKIEGNKLKLILNDDTVLGDITITVSGQNTKIKEFKYNAGVFKIIDTEDNVFPSGINLTQLFAAKSHNHDTEYVKLDDSRITTQYLPLSWNKRNNKEIIRTQSDNWLRINDLISHPNGVFFGNSIVRTDGQLQVGEGGNIFLANGIASNAYIIIGNKVRINTSNEENHVIFENQVQGSKLYGVFQGIKLHGLANDRFVLAGGGNISSNILVGGQNLLYGTSEFILKNEPYYLQSNYAGNAGYSNETFRGNKVLKLNVNWQGIKCSSVFINTYITVSFWAKTTTPNTKFISSTNSKVEFINGDTLNPDGQWHRYCMRQYDFRTYKSNYGFLEFYKNDGPFGEVYLSSVKLEYGYLPSDWSPAPEDSNFNRNDSILFSNLNTFKRRKTGGYYVYNTWGTGILLSFEAGGSTSSLEFYKANWYPETRIQVRNTVDSNRFNDDNGGFRDLAWYNDVIKSGAAISSNWGATRDWQTKTIFIEASCNVELNQLDNFATMSFRKVFAGGNITFSCYGKSIIYTSATSLNGGDGSTATINIYGNKCYIDIKNI